MRGSDHGSFGGKRQSRSIQSRPRLGDFVTRIFLQLSIHRLRLSSFLGQEYPYISMALSDPVRGYRLLRTRSGKSNFFLNIYIYILHSIKKIFGTKVCIKNIIRKRNKKIYICISYV